jgi:hypothetical protein
VFVYGHGRNIQMSPFGAWCAPLTERTKLTAQSARRSGGTEWAW